jgi:hypothetical protein
MSHLNFSKEDTSCLGTTLLVSESRNLPKCMLSMAHVMGKAINWHFQQSRLHYPIQMCVYLSLQWFCATELCVISHLSFSTTDLVFFLYVLEQLLKYEKIKWNFRSAMILNIFKFCRMWLVNFTLRQKMFSSSFTKFRIKKFRSYELPALLQLARNLQNKISSLE